MAAESDADRLDFFDSDDFGVTASFGSPTGDVAGILDNEADYRQAGPRGPMVENNVPVFWCRSSDVSAVASGDTVTISGVSYKVRRIQPDGTGITQIKLTEAS